MKIQKYLVLIIIILLIYSVPLFAAGAILNDANDFFSSHDPSNISLYIYNESDATNCEAGKYYCFNYTLKTIQVSIPTLGSTSITMRIEGRTDSSDDLTTWGDIYSKTYTSATTIDDFITVTEHTEYIRVGLLVVGDSTDDVTIKGNFGIPKALR